MCEWLPLLMGRWHLGWSSRLPVYGRVCVWMDEGDKCCRDLQKWKSIYHHASALRMIQEMIMTTGCLQCFWIQQMQKQKQKKDVVPNRVSSKDSIRKHTPQEAVPNAFFCCQINVRSWQISGKYVSFTFQKWTDLGHVLPNCGQGFPIC